MKTVTAKTSSWFHIQNLHQIALDRVLEGIRKSTGEFKAWVAARRTRRRDQAAFKQLLNLNDANLRDIGLTRADIYWANALPLQRSASLELQKLAHPGKAARLHAENTPRQRKKS